jgi:alkanesulfonate monooxygenase SsuD/methylene tetrahydromethanopterin reductase-like flavin-dependent oxidoreductase (luciferase family)
VPFGLKLLGALQGPHLKAQRCRVMAGGRGTPPSFDLRPLDVFHPHRWCNALPRPESDPALDRGPASASARPSRNAIRGNADEVADKLAVLQRATGTDELVITSITHRHEDRLRSHELTAKRWGLTN